VLITGFWRGLRKRVIILIEVEQHRSFAMATLVLIAAKCHISLCRITCPSVGTETLPNFKITFSCHIVTPIHIKSLVRERLVYIQTTLSVSISIFKSSSSLYVHYESHDTSTHPHFNHANFKLTSRRARIEPTAQYVTCPSLLL